MEKNCQQCGNILKEKDIFCGKCGAKVPVMPAAPEQPKKYCVVCGAELKADGVFCGRCGTEVNTGAASSLHTNGKSEVISDNAAPEYEADGREQQGRKRKSRYVIPVILCAALLIGLCALLISSFMNKRSEGESNATEAVSQPAKEIQAVLSREIFIYKDTDDSLYTDLDYAVQDTDAYLENWTFEQVLNEKYFDDIQWDIAPGDDGTDLVKFGASLRDTMDLEIRFRVEDNTSPVIFSLNSFDKSTKETYAFSAQQLSADIPNGDSGEVEVLNDATISSFLVALIFSPADISGSEKEDIDTDAEENVPDALTSPADMSFSNGKQTGYYADACIAFFADGTFVSRNNLYEGWGNMRGNYEINDTQSGYRIVCHVSDCNFRNICIGGDATVLEFDYDPAKGTITFAGHNGSEQNGGVGSMWPDTVLYKDSTFTPQKYSETLEWVEYTDIEPDPVDYTAMETTGSATMKQFEGTGDTWGCFKIYDVTSDEVYFEVDWYRLNGFGGVAQIVDGIAVFDIDVSGATACGRFFLSGENEVTLELDTTTLNYIEPGVYSYTYDEKIYTASTYAGSGEEDHSMFLDFLENDLKPANGSTWEYLGCPYELFVIPGELYTVPFDFYKVNTGNGAAAYYVVSPNEGSSGYGIYQVKSNGALEKQS